MTDNTTPAATAETLPYKNPDLPAGERIADLLSRMTLEEKVGQMMQLDARGGDLEDLIVNKHVGSILHTSPEDLSRAAKTVNEKTRLGIPLIIGDDCIHGYSFWPGATIFPSQLGMAVSWDPDKVKAAGRATAEEVSCTGVHWTFSPVLCIARDTRWGRVDETFGEDPMLIGELASAMVKGYQGGAKAGEELPKNAILACAKHFAGYSETQGGRDASEADLSHRKLESWFLPPFERVAKEGCGTFMLGYESIEGVPVTFNKWLLTDKLRGAWKYNGTLITDWDNVGRSVWEQHVKPDYVHAAADAVKAGNDLVMTTPQFYEGAIEAVKTGLLDESLIDDAVSRILALKFCLGLFEDPRLPDAERIKAVIGSAEHQQTNLELARESVALLRNDGTLPFAENTAKRIAVVGPLADDAQNQLGDWTGKRTDRKDDFWGNPNDTAESGSSANGTKSIFDPCPKGWMVASPTIYKEVLAGKDDAFEKNSSVQSLIYKYDGTNKAYWHFSGLKWASSGGNPNNNQNDILGVWSNSSYHGYEASDHNVYQLYYRTSQGTWNDSGGRAAGMSVRCMQDTENR